MSTIHGFQKWNFWSSLDNDMFEGVLYHFGCWMSANHFNDILAALCFTNITPPTFNDKLHKVWQLINKGNNYMANRFVPSWVSCLDKSMVPWMSKWTCPGWMVVPRKPHPYGNEYHSLCCGDLGIMYRIELVEGKDCPKDLGEKSTT